MSSLEAVLGNAFVRLSPTLCQIRLENVQNGPKQTIDASVQFRKSPHYPAQVVVSIAAAVPSYIKLSITRQVLVFMAESLSGEEIKLWSMMDWIQANINGIIERPGKLRDIASVASAASEGTPETGSRRQRRPPRHPHPIKWTASKEVKEQWLKREEDPAYQKMVAQRKKLPAWQMQERIVQTVADNQVTIISGETGSGKSTQSVQFILDDLYLQGLGQAANIIVTQPRRISALGLADRVSEERCSQVGQEIGYSIRGESKTSAQTRITFVTTGVLLRRFQTSGGRAGDVVASLADVSHVVIDEVHERSLDTDFLLAIIRDVLVVRKDLKLILMSATLDSASFRQYFTAERLTVGQVGIEGRTYPVQDYYLDDVLEMTGFSLEGKNRDHNNGDDDEHQAAKTDQTLEGQAIAQTIRKLGHRINFNLVAEATKAVDMEISHAPIKGGGILIFLPGVAEINQTCNLLRSQSQLHVLPLHASLETKEQRRVFAPAPAGKRKVVVATNVAETSITISDIVAVIDSGRVKETSFDPQKNMRRLEETWASRAAGKQRRGRAGRVREGTCYKLFTRNQESLMAERPEPEIRRVPLEQLCLSVRAMGIRDVASFLLKAPTPPESTAIAGAIIMLQRMGALDGSELTALGTQLAMIPADLRCGKLMVFGAIFGCLDECVTLAAVLNTRSPFVSPQDKREAAKEARMRFSEGEGDLLTDLRAVQEWDRQMANRTPQRQVRVFCEDNFLSWQTLQDIAATRTQYYSALKEIGIGTTTSSTVSSISGSSTTSTTTNITTTTNPPVSPMLLRALTASAFAPQIARIQFPEKKFASSMSGAVEIDPEARTIKYFAQDPEGQQSRVFVHPSSVLFDAQSFSGGAAFISYFGLMQTSKVFVRDLTRK
jgi:ATP-dependent RNA helicase DHX57